jgi:glycerol-3-phosphate dehydrogenase
MLGTTDTLYEGDPDSVEATEDDVREILAEAAVALEDEAVRREDVRATFAGLRVLPGSDRDTASTRREIVLSRGPAGMLTVAGGKLTTYRRIALSVMRALRSDLGLHRIDGAPEPLPGATGLAQAGAVLARRFPELDPSVRAHLLHLYGSLVSEVLSEAETRPELLERLHSDGPDLAAQAAYAWSREWATTDEDVLRRRTTVALRGLTVGDTSSVVR